jgi:hypothetical protein
MNNRIDSASFPHIIGETISPGTSSNGLETVYYTVDNGQTLEEKGWIYEADYPAGSLIDKDTRKKLIDRQRKGAK